MQPESRDQQRELSTPQVSVVVPLYNEGAVVNELLERLHAVLAELKCSAEIICVDDGSVDDSAARVCAFQHGAPQVVLVKLARNYGQTAALAAGIDFARGAVIITLDGDLQHAPEEIPRFLEKLGEGYDIVSGWREIRTDDLWSRRVPSRAANFLVRALSGVEIHDFGSTFKAYRASVLKQLELFGELHRFIPVLADRFGAKIVEIPITVHPRPRGTSNYSLLRTFGVFEDLVFLAFYSHYLTKPIRAFGLLFFLFFSGGFLISAALMGAWMIGSIPRVLDHGALLLFSVFLMIVGVQFLVAGVIAELLTRIYLHTGKSKIYAVREVVRQKE